MRIIQTEITPFINSALYLELREHPFLSSPYHAQPSFHKHPELQLTFILEGYGKRIIGNKITSFEPGDMVFIGSNVPHVWLSDPIFFEKDSILQSRVITVYINPKIFQQMFEYVEEMEDIKEMILQASKGINIFGETRNIIAKELMILSGKTGFEKVVGLLQIMNLISTSTDKSLILNKESEEPASHYSDRLIDVLKFMKENLQEQISLDQVAEVACMTVPSFCRFFKTRTKKTFSQYLVELRIAQACTILIEADKPISDIAILCGYNSASHFCKVFKDQTGQSPHQYKCSITQRAV